MTPEDLAHAAVWDHCAAQKEWELVELVRFLQQRNAPLRRVLEIGSERGGTFWLWSRLAQPDAWLMSVDLDMCPLATRLSQPTLRLRADSHRPSTLDKVLDWFRCETLDLLFIDGDHSYEGVKRDYEMYGPLVASGGLIIFHDIAVHDPSVGCHVDMLWAEISHPFCWEAVHPHRSDSALGVLPAMSCGIGVLPVD